MHLAISFRNLTARNRFKVSAKWVCFHFEFPHAVENAVEMIHEEARFAKLVGTRNHPLVPERERREGASENEREIKDFGDGRTAHLT